MMNINFDFNLFNNSYFFYEKILVAIISLIPTLLLVKYVLYTDRKSKEPTKNIVICLLSGILTIALARYFELTTLKYVSNNVLSTYIFAFIEEISKMFIFYLFVFDNKHYDDIYDGVVYMALIALSFAGLENIMYAFTENTVIDSIVLSIMRDFTSIPLHVICGIVIGYFLSIGYFSKDKSKKYINYVCAILMPTIMHGTYNILMDILGSLEFTSSLAVMCFETIPLILIMAGLFFIANRFINKTVKLNNTFINNEIYDKKYDYLMNKKEYMGSKLKEKRIIFYEKTNFNKDKDDD